MKCEHPDDVDLYNNVRTNPAAAPAARVNALVGLSVHYTEKRELREELTMAQAATDLATRLMPCEDRSSLSAWQGITCTLLFKRNDRNRRAYVAAWMQLGAAYSDYAPVAESESQQRTQAVAAYQHLLPYALDDPRNYAQAQDAQGVQVTLLQTDSDPIATYGTIYEENETAPAYVDRGLAWVRGRHDSFVRLTIAPTRLENAEKDFTKAISIDPNYWDAHTRLGYVLFEEGRSEKGGPQFEKLRDAADTLEVALAHDQSNRPLRRLLASVDANLCRFDAARKIFKEAYAAERKARDERAKTEADRAVEEQAAEKMAVAGEIAAEIPAQQLAHPKPAPYGLEVLADWGKVLDGFGFHDAAIEQEIEVLRQNPKFVEARMFLGQLKIKHRNLDAGFLQEGLNDLGVALASGADKSTTVLAAFLMGRVQTDRADEVVAIYRYWAQAGRVPKPVTLRQANPRTLPTDQRLRVIYALALDEDKEAAEAQVEWTALHEMGLRGDVEVADFVTQSRGIVGDEDVLSEQSGQPCSAWLFDQAPRLPDVAITD